MWPFLRHNWFYLIMLVILQQLGLLIAASMAKCAMETNHRMYCWYMTENRETYIDWLSYIIWCIIHQSKPRLLCMPISSLLINSIATFLVHWYLLQKLPEETGGQTWELLFYSRELYHWSSPPHPLHYERFWKLHSLHIEQSLAKHTLAYGGEPPSWTLD